MARRTFFRYIRDEESQNDFFISLLAFSLGNGPAVLNAIHDDLTFSSKAEVVATQRSGLPKPPTESGRNYTLDWVVRDEDKLVGYESKTGRGVPSNGQLDGELDKLRANTRGNDVFLYAFTDHHKNPIDRTDVKWMSWYEVASRVQALDSADEPVQILQEMFDERGYDQFEGFDRFEQSREWMLNHERQIVKLAFEIDRQADQFEIYTSGQNQVPQHTTTKQLTKVLNTRSHGLNQSIYAISFHPLEQSRYATKGYNLCLLVPLIRNELATYAHIKASRDELEEFVRSNASSIAEMVEEHGMTLKTSWNRLNDPERRLKQYDTREEVEEVLRHKSGSEYWKRLYFGWDVDTEQSAAGVVDEAGTQFSELYRLFFEPAAGLDSVPQY